jgi:transglutaminase-like putative cysteine protease
VIYDIRHVTTYSYESPVSFARCSLRLRPKTGDGQQLLSHQVDIRPRPTERSQRTDFFGIQTESIIIETAHRSLRIDSRSRVDVTRTAIARDGQSQPWEDAREAAFAFDNLTAASPVGYMFASPLAPIQLPVTAYAARSFPEASGILSCAADLMRRINADFVYDSKATEISTPLEEVFEKRRGVCQDFAHIMIAGLRGLGLPAAYVSGYLRTTPPPGKPRLQGADATHAWVSVWCGADIGWVGFDPTNDLMVGGDHVVLAVGRDYTDVSPVDGVIVGSRKQKLSVAVDVIPVE